MNRCTGSYGFVQADRPSMNPPATRREVFRGFIAPSSDVYFVILCWLVTVLTGLR